MQKEELPRSWLVTEILSRLPARSVLRFSSVSKQWLDIISEEYFRDLHSQNSNPDYSNPVILFFTIRVVPDPTIRMRQPLISISSPCLIGSTTAGHHMMNIKLPPQPLPLIESKCPIINTSILYIPSTACNGLLCIIPFDRFTEQSIMVCNPLTLEYLALPPLTVTTENMQCFVGLGFAPLSKEYKVVCIACTYTLPTRGAIKVYTIGADKPWREVQPHVYYRPHGNKVSTVLYVDGKIYWVIFGPRPYKFRLLSFDIESEEATVMGDIPGIDYTVKEPSEFTLVRLASQTVSLFVNQGPNIDVWVLKGCNEPRWDLRHRIQLPNSPRKMYDRLLNVWELVDGVILILLEDITMIYDGRTATASIEKGSDLPSLYSDLIYCTLCQGYSPSLVSLKKYGSQMGDRFSDVHRELVPLPNIQLP